MNAPIADFVRAYAASGTVRLHMPGHKGVPVLGCEALDLTEICGADALYEAEGIIGESEQNAAVLFGSGKTLYSTEGSSQCIRAMVFLTLTCRKQGAAPVILAARNAHKAFLYALALTGAEVEWLWGEDPSSLCSCRISPAMLENALCAMQAPPAAVWLTSPDYLGKTADISALAAVCRRLEVPLLVDNAHGAYQHFQDPPQDPLAQGAAMCCASAHKTLPVLTGGAYLHLASDAPEAFFAGARRAMELFGSTSPSYLILQSLDLCNQILADSYPADLKETIRRIGECKDALRTGGWQVEESDALRIVLRGDGECIAARLRTGGVEPEFSDAEHAVLMLTPSNREEDLSRLLHALGKNDLPPFALPPVSSEKPEKVLSVRHALFEAQEEIPVAAAPGRICASPSVSCPPAIPIAVAGERIGVRETELFQRYRIKTVNVIRQRSDMP